MSEMEKQDEAVEKVSFWKSNIFRITYPIWGTVLTIGLVGWLEKIHFECRGNDSFLVRYIIASIQFNAYIQKIYKRIRRCSIIHSLHGNNDYSSIHVRLDFTLYVSATL